MLFFCFLDNFFVALGLIRLHIVRRESLCICLCLSMSIKVLLAIQSSWVIKCQRTFSYDALGNCWQRAFLIKCFIQFFIRATWRAGFLLFYVRVLKPIEVTWVLMCVKEDSLVLLLLTKIKTQKRLLQKNVWIKNLLTENIFA